MVGSGIPKESSEGFNVVSGVAVRHVFKGLLHLDLAVSLQDLGFEDVLFANQEGRDVFVVEPLEPGGEKGGYELRTNITNPILKLVFISVCFFR